MRNLLIALLSIFFLAFFVSSGVAKKSEKTRKSDVPTTEAQVEGEEQAPEVVTKKKSEKTRKRDVPTTEVQVEGEEQAPEVSTEKKDSEFPGKGKGAVHSNAQSTGTQLKGKERALEVGEGEKKGLRKELKKKKKVKKEGAEETLETE